MPIRDIYMRDPSDPNYKENILEVSDEIEILVSQIKMILFTNQGDVLGAPDFGMSLDEMLFTFDANAFTLQNKLRDQLLKFSPLANRYNVEFDVKFFKGTIQDIALIDVIINDKKIFGVSVV